MDSKDKSIINRISAIIVEVMKDKRIGRDDKLLHIRKRAGMLARKLKNKRLGLTRIGTLPYNYYIKGGVIHHWDKKRDKMIASTKKISKNTPPWRGDVNPLKGL